MQRQANLKIFEPITKETIQARMDEAARVLDLPEATLNQLYAEAAEADETLIQQRYNFQHNELCHYGNDGLAWETFAHNLVVCLHQAVNALFQYQQAECLNHRQQFNEIFAPVANIAKDNTLHLSRECERYSCAELQALLTRLCYPTEITAWENYFLFQYLCSLNMSHGLDNYLKSKTIIFTKNKNITFDDNIHDLENRKKNALLAAKKMVDVITEKMKQPVIAPPAVVAAPPVQAPDVLQAPASKSKKIPIFKILMVGFCFVIGLALITASIVFSGGIAAVVLGIAGVLAIGTGAIATGMMNKGKSGGFLAYIPPMMMSTGFMISQTNSAKPMRQSQEKTMKEAITTPTLAHPQTNNEDDRDLQFPKNSPRGLRK